MHNALGTVRRLLQTMHISKTKKFEAHVQPVIDQRNRTFITGHKAVDAPRRVHPSEKTRRTARLQTHIKTVPLVVPDHDALMVETKVDPRDINNVSMGLRAVLRQEQIFANRRSFP